ncbi:endonuclease/exonuclease/phosphatase family protein [Nocardioides sp. URHA0032]|jgi:endonuclease/exonuclease/phosphatase family metal-dependent hydrolase|uniref:endonuclease/exonuclease/phosphatase family protein n=1 Tax=Nocardioides sp. URHA0032 TaxID=1380388 RepID=UPI00048C4340|nr:endonuclease/exonuclease/phosphatase family protein [Nocardioides sp. URHA0032]
MTKHVGPSDPAETTGAAVATIAVVGVLGLVIAVLAIFRPGGGAEDPGPSAADVAVATRAPTQSVSAGQRIHAAPTVKPQRVGKVGKELRRKTQKVAARKPTTFRIGTFNVLGASHTKAGGNKKGWAPAPTRMSWATSIVQASDADVIGFQEFESPQVSTFLARTAGAWAVFPGNAGDPRNSIAWRTSVWELVSSATVPIPYFHGQTVQMPYVRLHNIESDQDVYFINVHNPATTGRWGNNERWRDAATAREIALINQLHAQDFPVVLTGDFNERDEVFCKVTGSGAMVSASGGVASGGSCVPPSGMGVDWIFGSSVIRFSDYLAERNGLVQRATDHPFVVTTAMIPPLSDR